MTTPQAAVSPAEARAMDRALELAWRGWGRVAPNPLVGAVVLQGEQVVAEGWHAEFGGPHAERMALDAAGDVARGGTLVVTLEPCAHEGKQPPCAALVAERGVRRVVMALPDPNPVAAGGATWLEHRGVEVAWLPSARPAASAQNARFLHAVRHPGRAWVVLKLAASLDGFIADAGGSSRWVSGPEAREWVQWLRAGFDGIAVGGATARADDPWLTVRGALQPRVTPRRIVVSRGAGVAEASRLAVVVDGAPTLVVRVGGGNAPTPSGVEVLELDQLSDLPAALPAFGVSALLVEGGGRLAGSLLGEGLVDRVHWIAAPTWLGAGTRAVDGLAAAGVADAVRWIAVERRGLGDDTLMTLDRQECSPDS